MALTFSKTLQGNLTAAKTSLLKLHGLEFETDAKILSIQQSLMKKRLKEKQLELNKEKTDKSNFIVGKIKESLSKDLAQFKRPEVLKPFLIILLLSVVQQFSGMTILRAYVVKIFGRVFQNPGPARAEDNSTTLGNSTGKCYIFSRPLFGSPV